MQKLVSGLVCVSLLSFIFMAAPGAVEADELEAEFKIGLSGAEEVPPVATDAFGSADVELTGDGLAVRFDVEVCRIEGVTQAHIHVGAAGVNGPVVLFLYGFDPTGSFSADDCEPLSQGTLGPADLIPRPAVGINTWQDFVAALLAGNTYVNVHTLSHPAGLIRGQLD